MRPDVKNYLKVAASAFLLSQERELELQKEQRRQEENDKLRQEFAQHANAFHQWIQETRCPPCRASPSMCCSLQLQDTGSLFTTWCLSQIQLASLIPVHRRMAMSLSPVW